MSYLGEIRRNSRPLVAASLGSGTSMPFFAYTNSIFAPHLIQEFEWSRSQFALVGLTMLFSLPLLPIVGRVTDLYGVRRVALVGTILILPCYIAYSLMQGSFPIFLVIFTAVLAVSSMTSTLTYSRLVAENFSRAQGLALTIMNCTPAALAIAAVPLLNGAIAIYGWRAAYVGLGIFSFAAGLVAVVLIPPTRDDRQKLNSPEQSVPTLREDYGIILRSRVFWLILGGMFLCLLQTPLHSGQMSIMLLENGLTSQEAARAVSVYAFGTIIGRIVCGLALDRFSTPIVTAVSMVLPAVGYLLLGSRIDETTVITGAMFLIGLSIGAESDLVAYLIARYFHVRIFSTTFSLLFGCSFLASAAGALLISLTLSLTDSFAPYLIFVAVAIIVGSAILLLLPKSRDVPKVG